MHRAREAMKLLARNPQLFFYKCLAELKSCSPVPASSAQKKINGILFEFDFGLDPAILAMYYRNYEVATVVAMKKHLKQGDIFIDVGANIGYLSALAMGFVGKNGEVHSFEPVPEYCRRLRRIAVANKDYKVVVNECALGEKETRLRINVTNLRNIGWNTLVPGYMSRETTRESLDVPVYRLDEYIKAKSLKGIALIKIDTEGFEFPVLKGLSGYFDSTRNRPVIICEIAPQAFSLLNCSIGEFDEYMMAYGYHSFSLHRPTCEIDITKLEEITDVVFKPDGLA